MEDEGMDSDQESVDGNVNEKPSDTSPPEEVRESLPEESTAGEQSARSSILDKTEEDDAYDFSTDYV